MALGDPYNGMNGHGSSNDGMPSLTELVLGPAPEQATAALYQQMAHSLGLAMQNVVTQQQTLNTINNAIATKALTVLVEKDPAKALEAINDTSANPKDVAAALKMLMDTATGKDTGTGGTSDDTTKPDDPDNPDDPTKTDNPKKQEEKTGNGNQT